MVLEWQGSEVWTICQLAYQLAIHYPYRSSLLEEMDLVLEGRGSEVWTICQLAYLLAIHFIFLVLTIGLNRLF